MTDEDRLIRCLITNRSALAELGTNIPSPSAYRKLFRDVFTEAHKNAATTETRDTILNSIIGDEPADRLVLSNSGFFGTPKMAAEKGTLYPATVPRLELLQEIFENDKIEIFMAICNPATFLPATLEKTPYNNMTDYLHGAEPSALRWSEMFKRISDLFPNIAVTVWCNEDTPMIWGQIIRELAGVNPTTAIEDEFSLLSEIMSEVGMQRFNAYIASRPDMTETQKRRIISAFLQKFADESAIMSELDVPGWTEQLVDQLTEIYDEDVYTIQRIPGINLITP